MVTTMLFASGSKTPSAKVGRLSVVLGPVYGAIQGASADWGYVANGEYGIEGRPDFDADTDGDGEADLDATAARRDVVIDRVVVDRVAANQGRRVGLAFQ